jgi:hypothetical protein
MANPRPRTAALCLCCLLVSPAIAGCLGGSGVPTDDAKERALSAEEDYITRQFENASCVEGWSLTSFVGVEEAATVTNRTADGVYVAVTHPYSYSTEQVEADVGSDARYFVTADTIERVDGTEVSPC